MAPKEQQEKVTTELLIRFEGSLITNRIAVFELPIVARQDGAGEGEASLQFESRELVWAIKQALKKMV